MPLLIKDPNLGNEKTLIGPIACIRRGACGDPLPCGFCKITRFFKRLTNSYLDCRSLAIRRAEKIGAPCVKTFALSVTEVCAKAGKPRQGKTDGAKDGAITNKP
jgi:hypothetical protein